MRKLLLASAAMLGAVSAGAQAQQPSQGQVAAPWFSGPASQTAHTAGESLAGYTGASFAAVTNPTPGTVVIRLNGRVQSWVEFTSSPNNRVGTAGATGTSFKVNPISMQSYIRLYPGVDGMATNGLRYGASVEIRQQLVGSSAVSGVSSGLGGGTTAPAGGLGAAGPSTSGATAGQTLFVNKAFAYFAMDNVGLFRIGQAPGLAHLFDPAGNAAGTGWDGGFGALNGAGPLATSASNGFAVAYALTDQGNEYSNPKLVYMSPQFFGFDVGVQYAPGMYQNTSCTNASSAGCSTTTTGSDPTRWYNQVAIGARYQGVFGPVSLGVHGFWEHAAKENFNGTAVNHGGATRTATGTKFDDLDFFVAAGSLAYASPVGTFTAGLTYLFGDMNGGPLALKPTGGVKEHQFVGGVKYANGPLTLGVQFNRTTSQGSNALVGVSQRNESAIAVGGSYTIAPGAAVFADYYYTMRHQGGFDFVANSTGATPAAAITRDGRGQAIIIGTAIGW